MNRARQTALHILADAAGAGDSKSRNNRPLILSKHYNSMVDIKAAIKLDIKEHGAFLSLGPVGVALGRALRAGDVRAVIEHGPWPFRRTVEALRAPVDRLDLRP